MNLSVCFFGIYDPKYPRNRVIIKGLEKNNVRVIRCRVKCFERAPFGLKDLLLLGFCYIKLAQKYLKILKRTSIDVILVGYPGWHVIPIAKFLSLITKKPIIFDAFYSIYDTDVLDRKIIKRDSIYAKILYFIDKISCNLADLILLDTAQHISFFSKEFNIDKNKFQRLLVGSDDEIFRPLKFERKSYQHFLVTFWGSFIPLHGIRYIIQAAKLLENDKVKFKIIGNGQIFEDIQKLCSRLKVKNVSFIPYIITYEKLVKNIAKSDICLGIFGTTNKAKRVIPNKVYEALAMAKPVITCDSPAIREILVNYKNCILCKMGDPQDLARSILLLKNDNCLRERIAKNGYGLFKRKLTPYHIGRELKKIILNFLKTQNKL